MKNTPN